MLCCCQNRLVYRNQNSGDRRILDALTGDEHARIAGDQLLVCWVKVRSLILSFVSAVGFACVRLSLLLPALPLARFA